MPQDRVQPAQPFSAPLQGGSTPKIQPTHFEDGASQPILKSPAPKRVIKSPILGFQSSQPSNPTADSLPIPKAPSLFGANFNQNPQSQPPAPFAFTPTPTISFPSSPSNGLPKLGTPDIPATITPLPLSEESSLSLKKHRQSLFERQEKLLHDELAFQDRERQSILNQHKREQQKSFELARQQTLERAQQRLKESVLLQNEKIETQERQHHERIMKEQRKVQTEKTVQFYAEEIVNSIVQEHVLEVSASELAVAFHRRVFLKNVLHRLSKICKRSVLRKKVQLEQIAQARRRKTLVDRALAELDNGERGPLSKKPRRRSQRIRLGETEEELTEVLAKVLF
jgi:hypothetical protein